MNETPPRDNYIVLFSHAAKYSSDSLKRNTTPMISDKATVI